MGHITVQDALLRLSKADRPFKTVFEHGTLTVEIYKPDQVDLQQPHTRDEVYIIAEGSGSFIHEGTSCKVSKGDFLFVPSGDKHRFVEFTEEFSTWVLFYGPEGGE